MTTVVHVLPRHSVEPAILELAEGVPKPAADGLDFSVAVCGTLGHREEVRQALHRSRHVAPIRRSYTQTGGSHSG